MSGTQWPQHPPGWIVICRHRAPPPPHSLMGKVKRGIHWRATRATSMVTMRSILSSFTPSSLRWKRAARFPPRQVGCPDTSSLGAKGGELCQRHAQARGFIESLTLIIRRQTPSIRDPEGNVMIKNDDEQISEREVIGCCPVYIKTHSQGE